MEIDIVRAWKDAEYRKTLTPEQLATLPPSPAGSPELTEDELKSIAGGLDSATTRSSGSNCCCGSGGCR